MPGDGEAAETGYGQDAGDGESLPVAGVPRPVGVVVTRAGWGRGAELAALAVILAFVAGVGVGFVLGWSSV